LEELTRRRWTKDEKLTKYTSLDEKRWSDEQVGRKKTMSENRWVKWRAQMVMNYTEMTKEK